MGQSRVENILQAMIDGTSSSELPAAQSRNEELLKQVLDKMNDIVDPEVVAEAVDAWLDEHPEATTTVEDCSITKAKLDSNLQGTVDDVVELKSAINAMGVEETQTGNYYVLTSNDNCLSVKADNAVIVGNKNMIPVLTNDVVGKEYTAGGITRVRNADDSYTFSGIATRKNTYTLVVNIAYLPSGVYTLSGCPTGAGCRLNADYFLDGTRKGLGRDTGNTNTGTLLEGGTNVTIYFEIPNDTILSTPITVKPQLERGETATEYVKCSNHDVSANANIPIDGATYIFASTQFTLTTTKIDIPEIREGLEEIEDDISDINSDIQEINEGVNGIKDDVAGIKDDSLKPYPQNAVQVAQMITITDGAEQMPVESMIVNISYSTGARTKLRSFVSSKNLFNLDDVITKRHITKNQDGTITVPGTNLTTSIYTGAYGINATVPIEDMVRMPFLPAGRYYISNSDNWTNVTVVNPSTGEQTAVAINNDKRFTLEEDSLINIYIRNTVTYIMLSVDPNLTYVQNPGKTYVVPFVDLEGNAFTMYGGTVDLVNGIATELYDSSGDELVAPVIHSITPVNVITCLGCNHIWSDCTSVAVTYRADVKMYVDQRNKSDALEQYNIDASEFGVVRIGDFMSPNTNVIAIAHRGLSRYAPENTMPAFKAAAEAGFLVAETDVDWTSDGVPVLIHDSTINRTARNADGTEITSIISIRDITYAQALEYDFGIWKGEEFAGTKIPTFDEFILFCKRAGICPQIELKYNQQTQEQTNLLIQKVVAHGMINRVSWVSNFKDLLLQVLSVHQGAYVVLVGSDESRYNDVLAIKAQHPAANVMLTCGIDYMTAEEMAAMVARLKAAMIPMGIWTIDNSATIKRLDPYIIAITSNMLNAATVLREAVLE